MRESKAESIKRISNLVGAVHECSRVLTVCGSPMQEKMDQFEFELRTELRRFAGVEAAKLVDEAADKDLKTAIESALDHYRQAMNTTLPARTRAMLTRQSEELMSFQCVA
jgi:hypothetical protein